MTQRRRRQAGARRAQENAAQRVQQRKQSQRKRIYMIGGGVALVIAAIVASQLISFGPDLGEKVQALAGTHNPPFTYSTRPPTSGNHSDTSPYGFNSAPLVGSNVVHNMEHGAVVIWFQPNDDALEDQVRDLVSAVGGECLVAGPYADMDDTVAVTGWGRILRLDAFNSAQIREFITAYRGELGPEAGTCRSES